MTQRAADLTGLPAGIPVVAGTSDMAASLLGSGVYEPGMASDSTGTSTLMTVVSPRQLHHPLVNNLHLANAAWGGFTILDAGGDAVRWARLALADNQITHPQLLQEAAAVPAGAEGLLFLPYLTGERLAEHTNSRAQFLACSASIAAVIYSAQFWKGWPLHPGAIFGSCRSAGSIRNK